MKYAVLSIFYFRARRPFYIYSVMLIAFPYSFSNLGTKIVAGVCIGNISEISSLSSCIKGKLYYFLLFILDEEVVCCKPSEDRHCV